MSVLLLGQEWFTTVPGGLNRYFADLHAGLVAQGVRARAVVVGPAPSHLPSIVGVSEPTAHLVQRLARFRAAARATGRDADVVDCHFALYALLAVYTTPLRHVPLVVHFQGPWADESRLTRRQGSLVIGLKRTVERAVYRRAHTIVVLSEAFRSIVVERYGVSPARVVVVPPAVDLERFRSRDQTSARRRLRLPEAAFIVTCVRRLDARMGLEVLLRAWVRVLHQEPTALLLIAGEGPEREALHDLIREIPEPASVRLLGRVLDENLVDLYSAADCSVVPTTHLEGFGLVTLESAACGAPPIVTNVGGLPDGVASLDPSLIVPADDDNALAMRLLSACSGQLPSREACRLHAETFSRDVVDRHVRLYRGLSDTRPLRVAYLGHTASLSGGELALARLIPTLSNIEAIVLLGEEGPLADRLRSEGVAVEVLPMEEDARRIGRARVQVRRPPMRAAVNALRYAWILNRRLRALNVDIVHTNTLKAAIYGALAGRLAGVPVIWHLRDRIATDYMPRSAVSLVRAFSWLPSAIIANSQSTLSTIGRRRRTRVIPSAVRVRDERRDRGQPSQVLQVGIVGRLAPWKGQDIFLQAFARAFPGGKERAIVIGAALFGEDAWEAHLVELCQTIGIADRVSFTGFVHDVDQWYDRLDILVHSSTVPEPFGQVVVEGMSAGVPVVAANAGGPAEVISNGVDGLLYDMGDVDALAACLRTLARDPDLRSRMAAAGRARAVHFGVESVADQVREVYRSVGVRRTPGRFRVRRTRAG